MDKRKRCDEKYCKNQGKFYAWETCTRVAKSFVLLFTKNYVYVIGGKAMEVSFYRSVFPLIVT
ncbi:MAG: hypothetical protein ACOCVX_05630, partial [Bacteroidales bacterium]